MVKPGTIRLLLSLTVTQQWPIKQIDVHNAFLHGLLHEEVYMQQPQGYVHPDFPNHFFRLKKSLYGLKQAPRAWFSRLTEKLQHMGLLDQRQIIHYSLFTGLSFLSSSLFMLI